MHELHRPDNCGIYCQLWCEIRPYGHCAPTDDEFYHDMHDPENYGEKCVTQSDGKSDISVICDIGEISEKAVSGVPRVPDVCDICAICDVGDMCNRAVPGVPGVLGVPNIPHGLENCGVRCVTRRYNGGSDDRASDSCHSDMCASPPGLGACGASQFVYMDAPGSDDAGVGNRSYSETPDFSSDHDPGPGKALSGVRRCFSNAGRCV